METAKEPTYAQLTEIQDTVLVTLTDDSVEVIRKHVLPAIDFETRLTIAHAGLDALLAHRHGDALAEAHTAVAEAMAEAQRAATVVPLTPELAPVDPSVQRVLNRAADLIGERGWNQGNWQSSATGAVCVMRAIRITADGNGEYDQAVTEVMRRTGATGEPVASVTSWNDSPARMRHEILDMLRGV